jgi:hypothetical protein
LLAHLAPEFPELLQPMTPEFIGMVSLVPAFFNRSRRPFRSALKLSWAIHSAFRPSAFANFPKPFVFARFTF